MTRRFNGLLPRCLRRIRTGRGIWVLAVAVIYLIPLFSLEGALDIYLKLGDIKGESTAKDHKDEIEIISWGWAGSRASGSLLDRSRDRSLKDVNALVLSKRTDRSTPEILLNCFAGKHIPEATLTIARSGEDPLEFLKIELKDVLVASYDVDGADGVEPAVEKFGLAFDYIKATYTLFGNDDKESGSSEVFWTLSTGTGGGSSSGGGGTGPPPNAPPTISAIASQTIDEDDSVMVTFTISDPETPAGALTLGRSSSNQTLLPLANMVFGGSGSTRTATLTPAPDQNGSSSVVITVSDGSKTSSSTFTLTVNPVNDPPGFQQIGAQTTEADTPLELDVTLSDLDSNLDNIALTGLADPPHLVASIEDTTQSGNLRRLTITPAPGATGTTTIALTATDDALPVAGQTQTSFSLSINPPSGQGPTAILINSLDSTHPLSIDENLPIGTEVGVLQVVGEPGFEYDFTLLNSAEDRFALGGPNNQNLVVSNGALLDFEDSPSHTIVIQATQRTAPMLARTDTFLIELQNVNEPPLIALPLDFGTTPPDRDHSLDGILIDDPDSGLEDIVATFTVGDGVLTLDDTGALAGKTTGNATNSITVTAPLGEITAVLAAPFGLVYRSDSAFTGTETLVVATDDGGNTGPPGPQGDNASSTLEVKLTPWELWRRANFTAAELLDPNLSSFTADPDRDGLANGGEYGVGGNPKDRESGPDRIDPVELVYLASSAETYLNLRFVRRISDPDFTISVEVASDLLNWVSGPAYTTQESVSSLDNDFDQPTIRTFFPLAETPRQQVRLRFRLDSP